MRMQCERVSLFVQQCRHRALHCALGARSALVFLPGGAWEGVQRGMARHSSRLFSLDVTFAQPFQLSTSQKQISELAHHSEECSNRIESLRREDVDVKTDIVNEDLRGAHRMAELVRGGIRWSG